MNASLLLVCGIFVFESYLIPGRKEKEGEGKREKEKERERLVHEEGVWLNPRFSFR